MNDNVNMTNANALVTTDNWGIFYHTVNDVLHRTDGPAIEWPNGVEEWYYNGERHREDGPAFVCPDYIDGETVWYWHGVEVDKLTHLLLRTQGKTNI